MFTIAHKNFEEAEKMVLGKIKGGVKIAHSRVPTKLISMLNMEPDQIGEWGSLYPIKPHGDAEDPD